MKMTDTALLAAIQAAEQAALGYQQSELASSRAEALKRYNGEPYGDEQVGRSQVVSRDVSDVVEGVLANVLKPFISGDRVVQFDPLGPEDEEQAQQETDYINFVAMERNNGFLVLNAAVKDALLLRAGYIKAGWTKRQDVLVEMYEGLSDDELNAIAKDDDVEVVEHSEYPGPQMMRLPIGGSPSPQGMAGPMASATPAQAGGMPAPSMLHDIKVRRTKPTEYVEILPVPPDEVLVSRRARSPSMQDIDFVQHVPSGVTISDLREMGYDVDDDIGLNEGEGNTQEEYVRTRYGQIEKDDETQDPSRRIVDYRETWMRIDHDGDGIAELRKVCKVGQSHILANEEADIIPMASFCAVFMPHQHVGISIYDLVQDLAQIKTALMRQFLDWHYIANNPRTIVNVNDVNVDDLLISRPGGIIRTQGLPGEGVMPMPVAGDPNASLQGLEYLDSVRENRTGYTRYAQGMESDSLQNKTLGGLQMAMSQTQMRLEMITRTIAETGVRDMFRVVHALTLKHSTREEKVRLRNKWVLVDPREWVKRTDLSISVGLGSGNREQQIQYLMMLGQAQQQAFAVGLVQPQNVYNLLEKLTSAAGFKNPEEFFTAPQPGQQPQQPPNPLAQAEQVKAQAQMQKTQAELQADAQKTQAEHAFELQKLKMQLESQERVAALNNATKTDLELAKLAEERALQIHVQDREDGRLQQGHGLEREKLQSAQKTEERRRVHERALAKAKEMNEEPDPIDVLHGSMSDAQNHIAQLSETIRSLLEQAAAPKRIIRGPDGRATGVESGGTVRHIVRGPDGRAIGVQ